MSMANEPTFASELESLLNRHSQERRSNSPDFILQDFLLRCLNAWNECTVERDRWYAVRLVPGDKRFLDKEVLTMSANTETAGAERPQLAADWVEDCLPDSGR